MFDTIILLTGPAEHSVFTTLLRGHHPSLHVVPVFTAADLAAIETDWLSRARLISFVADVNVPGAVIEQLGYGAYNFHAGPPSYPGRGAAQLALRDRAVEFGGTMHRVIDGGRAGPIIDVDLFAIPSGIDVGGLEEIAYTHLMQMFWRMSRQLATQSDLLIARALRWGGRRPTHAAELRATICPLPVSHGMKQMIDPSSDDFSIAPSLPGHRPAAHVSTPQRDVSAPASAEA